MYYVCNLYLFFTCLVSYTVILVVYDYCKWFVFYPHVNVQTGSCDFKFGRILNFKPIGLLVSILQMQTWSYSLMSGISL